ncbi:N-acyl-phosphatidylethanolamine-hydrolyzing phospholipase D-like [Liolophura sinensis]|uniref:N-acyl-phosphatidylethanolamine-hydrolyzing phospholipase D-like n=1 Tax=Liolophura sinensis TaxID=3198878 RepID=UPI0031588351
MFPNSWFRPFILPACVLLQNRPTVTSEQKQKSLTKGSHLESCIPLLTMAKASESKPGLTHAPFKNGRFENPWPNFQTPSVTHIFSLMRTKDLSKIPPKKDLDKALPIITPDFREFDTSPSSGVRVCWLGHASVLVQFDNITVLTDPIFSQYCSPVQFAGPKRYRDPPCTIEDLPVIDAVVISHNHYDHLDVNSVKDLNKKYGEGLYWVVPMGLATWMRDCGCKNVVELEWWDKWSIPGREEVKFVSTPSNHWCNRGLFDRNKVLWCSWAVIGPSHRFFFGGDTGYCTGFKEIGNEYGPFDLSAIPIGAYYPRWFMKSIHVNPEEAVQIHQDIRSKTSVGIHWGTFKMTSEHYLEPKEKLKEAATEQNLPPDSFITVNHGDIHILGRDTYTEMD